MRENPAVGDVVWYTFDDRPDPDYPHVRVRRQWCAEVVRVTPKRVTVRLVQVRGCPLRVVSRGRLTW